MISGYMFCVGPLASTIHVYSVYENTINYYRQIFLLITCLSKCIPYMQGTPFQFTEMHLLHYISGKDVLAKLL